MLKQEVLEEESNDTVKKIYRVKINELLATVRMLKAVKDGEDRRFSRYSEFIHGKPTPENSNYVFDAIKYELSKLEPKTESQEIAIRQIIDLIFDNEYTVPSDSVGREVLPEIQNGGELISGADEAATAIEEALNAVDAHEWEVVIDSEKGISNFSVSQEHQVVRVPATDKILKRGLTHTKLKALVEHEINTHVVRRVNGERSKLQLLGLGLDRYVTGEEGVATYREQAITGAKEFAGIPYYFACSLAKGFDGNPRDFRDVFEIMKLYYEAKGIRDPESSAWNACVRVFRGTSCSTPGAIYTKDLAYLTGNKAVWNLVSKNSDVIMTFDVGKFDPTRPDHVALLSQLGIIDNDLESLEKAT